jgi:DNA-binding HxlR family transcriptional regulator
MEVVPVKRYGQYCPVARAAEVLDQRWTLLVIRELLWGNDRFNAIARGVPRMAPALLSTRLRELQHAGLLERRVLDGEPRYRLTPAGLELRPIVEQLGAWGQRWMQHLRADEYDPALLMLDISREAAADPARLPAKPTTVQLELSAVPERYRNWWLVFSATGIDVCDSDPGRTIQVWLTTDVATLTRIWLGQISWTEAVRTGTLQTHGERAASDAVPHWLGVSRFATVEPASTPLLR